MPNEQKWGQVKVFYKMTGIKTKTTIFKPSDEVFIPDVDDVIIWDLSNQEAVRRFKKSN